MLNPEQENAQMKATIANLIDLTDALMTGATPWEVVGAYKGMRREAMTHITPA